MPPGPRPTSPRRCAITSWRRWSSRAGCTTTSPRSSRAWCGEALGPGPRRHASARRSDAEHLDQPLLLLGVDPRHHLEMLLESRAAQFFGQQLIDLVDAGAVRHRDLDPHGPLLARGEIDLVDRVGRQRVDVVTAGLERDAGATAGHVEGVGDPDDPGLDRERMAVAAVPDDRV